MKILHTSDWHLGRLFHQMSLLDEQQHLLQQLLQYIEQRQPDVVIIAGDIYDRSVPPAAAVRVFNQFVDQCINQYQTPIIAISGNHDGADRLGFGANQLKKAGLHLITDLSQAEQPVVLNDQNGPVYFWALPFHDPAQVADLTGEPQSDYNQAHQTLVDRWQRPTDAREVVISHCYLSGGSESDSERPLAIGGADQVDWRQLESFNYAALGHLHQPQQMGQAHIRYSGSLMKYSFSEQHHQKAATWVELDDVGNITTEQLTLTSPRDVRVIEGSLADIAEHAKTDPHTDDYVQIVLTDKDAILNPMARLRALYPNVLELRKQRFQVNTGAPLAAAQEQLKRADNEVFADFFSQVHDEPLTEAQQHYLQQLLAELDAEERNQ